MSLASVPTLEQIIADKRALDGLPPRLLRLLRARAMVVANECEVAYLLAEARGETDQDADDKLLSAEEAAPMLGLTPVTLLRRRTRQPFHGFLVPTLGRPRFSRRAIQDYLARTAGSTVQAPPRRP